MASKNRVFQWYCPNCAKLVGGFKRSDGNIHQTCPKCGMIMIRVNISRREDAIIWLDKLGIKGILVCKKGAPAENYD